MRIELAGSLIQPNPMLLTFVADDTFTVADYTALGYTHFDVICIGGGGGRGGGIDTANTGTLIRNYGGAGGGGGFHRVRGLLSALPSSCPVVVGIAGVAGTDDSNNPANTTDGEDGGYSSFNNPTCRASGGKGGKRAQSNSETIATQADGGQGGIGNATIAGGGALGGIAGVPANPGPGTLGTDGADGTFISNVGRGGGGGAGGVGKYDGSQLNPATKGGKGAYNPGDMSVYGLDELPSDDPVTFASTVVPGRAGGAKASPLNGLPTQYGRSGQKGVVVVLLTAE